MTENIKNKDADAAQTQDLEEGLEESFPASDAPAATQPKGNEDGGEKGRPTDRKDERSSRDSR